jgi:hypothetical protein
MSRDFIWRCILDVWGGLTMHCHLRIEMDNEIFERQPENEVARLLREAACRVIQGEVDFSLRDVNGNTVGTFGIEILPEDLPRV